MGAHNHFNRYNNDIWKILNNMSDMTGMLESADWKCQMTMLNMLKLKSLIDKIVCKNRWPM